MARVLVPLAPGFEEIEAIAIVDVLRRGGVEVVVAGLYGNAPVEGSHGIAVLPDQALDVVKAESFDMLILPGGEPGTTNLAASDAVRELLQQSSRQNRPLGAICAAPRLLAACGLLTGRRATSHPSVEAQLREHGARYDCTSSVVCDDGVITSRGPGTALEFALQVLRLLGRPDQSESLREAMLVETP